MKSILKRGQFLVAALIMTVATQSTAQEATHIPMPLDEVEFRELEEGLAIAVLSGNPRTGPSTFLLRLPAGREGEMHSHGANYTAVVIKGQTKHWSLGETEEDAPLQSVGDAWYQAAGAVHQDSNPTDSPAILFITMDGKQTMKVHGH